MQNLFSLAHFETEISVEDVKSLRAVSSLAYNMGSETLYNRLGISAHLRAEQIGPFDQTTDITVKYGSRIGEEFTRPPPLQMSSRMKLSLVIGPDPNSIVVTVLNTILAEHGPHVRTLKVRSEVVVNILLQWPKLFQSFVNLKKVKIF